MIYSAILIDLFEIFKIIIFCIRSSDPWGWTGNLPLFLCSIQLITIPLAAFSVGRVKEAALDFVFIFGLLGALLGTFAAGNNYAVYPVLGIDNVVSGITHCISGFVSLYIGFSKMTSMKRKNLPIVFCVLFGVGIAAYIANIFTDCNYMFLTRGDGTPYDLVYNLVGGNQVFYPFLVMLLFVVYIFMFHFVFDRIANRKCKKTAHRAVFLIILAIV